MNCFILWRSLYLLTTNGFFQLHVTIVWYIISLWYSYNTFYFLFQSKCMTQIPIWNLHLETFHLNFIAMAFNACSILLDVFERTSPSTENCLKQHLFHGIYLVGCKMCFFASHYSTLTGQHAHCIHIKTNSWEKGKKENSTVK